MQTIYILAISHEFQGTNPEGNQALANQTREFKGYLKNKLLNLPGIIVAEEWCKESSHESQGNKSNVESVIEELEKEDKKAEYLKIEMDKTERESFGVPLPHEVREKLNLPWKMTLEQQLLYDKEHFKYFSIREAYWLGKLKRYLETGKSIFLIVGGNHTSIGNTHIENAKGFDQRLSGLGYKVEILNDNDYFRNLFQVT